VTRADNRRNEFAINQTSIDEFTAQEKEIQDEIEQREASDNAGDRYGDPQPVESLAPTYPGKSEVEVDVVDEAAPEQEQE
jgi:hypothetical protein